MSVTFKKTFQQQQPAGRPFSRSTCRDPEIKHFLHSLVVASLTNKNHCSDTHICNSEAPRERFGLRVRRTRPYVMVRGLTEVWELMGEGPCWKGLGLWPSGVAGEVLGRMRPTGWMAPGRVWRENEREFLLRDGRNSQSER